MNQSDGWILYWVLQIRQRHKKQFWRRVYKCIVLFVQKVGILSFYYDKK